jgi:hypothetical protein
MTARPGVPVHEGCDLPRDRGIVNEKMDRNRPAGHRESLSPGSRIRALLNIHTPVHAHDPASDPENRRVDAETKATIKGLTMAIDSIAGMVAGCAAYIATLEGAHEVDKRKAIGISRRRAPEGLTGDASRSPAIVAQAMIEEIAGLARDVQALKQRAKHAEPRPLARDWHGQPAEINPMFDFPK